MSKPDSRTDKGSKANSELLQKGILIAFIGLAVLLAPYFIKSPEMQAIVAGAYLVGWFSLVLGGALVVQAVLRRRADK
jgi:uncharacterized membrane protein HdeD (DUF308 family)